MSFARQRLGRRAEDIVARELGATGWQLVARNVRVPEIRGEIDLIALDGLTLVFVEVKALRAPARSGPETPAAAVGPRKRAKLRRLAVAWLRDRGSTVPHRGLRFDVIGVRLDGSGTVVERTHLRGAF
jgi:putative endonuclease